MRITAKEKPIHDQGLATVLRQIHDELDEAVLEADGWGDLAAPEEAPTEAPHSCGAGGCGVFEKREALPQRLSIRIHDKSVVAPEAPHSCGAGGCGVFEKREALPRRLSIRIHHKSVVAP